MIDELAVEVPRPLAKFQGERVIHEDNALALAMVHTPRITSNRQLRKYEKALKRYQRQLDKAGIDALLHEYRTKLQQFNECRLVLNDLKAQYEATKNQQIRRDLRHSGKAEKARRNELGYSILELIEIIRPYRPLLAYRLVTKERIADYHIWLADEKENNRLTKEMAKEANYIAEMIINAWNQLGYCYDYHTHKGKRRRKSVRFERIVATPDSLQLKIYMSKMGLFKGTIPKLPPGVHIVQLVKNDTLIQLTASTERRVSCPQVDATPRSERAQLEYDPGAFANGAWLEVSRTDVTDGIKNKINYDVLMSRYEDRFNRTLALPLGVAKGRKINWVHLIEHPHLLIAGQTGSGKSNAVNVCLATFITRHSPDTLRLVLIDLKEGVELRRYEGIPHVVGKVITEIADVENALWQLEMLRVERMKQIREISAADIDQYNAVVPVERRIPRVVIVFDEYGALAIDKDASKRVYDYTAQLAMKARAAGIHLLIGSQTTYNEIIPNTIKSQITLVMVGRQRTLGSSMSTIGNKSASELPKIPGRMICDNGSDDFQVQLPYISPEQIQAAIERAREFSEPTPLPVPELPTVVIDGDLVQEIPASVEKPFDMFDFIGICINELDGLISPDRAHKLVKDKVTQRQLRAMRDEIVQFTSIEYEGNEYQIERIGAGYKLVLSSPLVSQSGENMPIEADFSQVLENAYIEVER